MLRMGLLSLTGKEREKMANCKCTEVSAVLAFLTGAAVGAVAALLVTPSTGEEMRGRIGSVTDDAVQKLKDVAQKAKFSVARKTDDDAFKYDGGDCWI